MLKIIGKISNVIWQGSISILVVGGAVVVLGKCYSLGKEMGADFQEIREARRKGVKADG